MSIEEEKIVIKKYCCDTCGDKNNNKDITGWQEITLVVNKDTLLLQKPRKYSYETFDIPNKKLCVFCSKECLKKFIDKETTLFISGYATFNS